MANVSQGTVVTWGGVTFGEVVTVAVDGVAADTVEVTPRTSTSRYKTYSPSDIDRGSVTLTVRSSTGLSSTNVGLTGTLSITGPSITWSFPAAIYEKISWVASTGEMQVFTVTFKVGA